MCFIIASVTYAGALDAPTDFVPGTPIIAGAVNTNFDNIDIAVDGNATDINTLQGKVTALENTSSVFRATDRDSSGTLTGADIQATMDLCVGEFAKTGCIIELLNQTYTDVRIEIPVGVKELRPIDDADASYKPILVGHADPLTNARVSPPVSTDSIYEVVYVDSTNRTHPLWIHDFKIDGNKQNWVLGSNDNNFAGTSPYGIDNGWDHNDTHDCISVTSTADGTVHRANGIIIERMHIENCGKGIQVLNAENVVIRDNLLQNFGCWDQRAVFADHAGTQITGVSNLPDWTPNGIPVDQVRCGAWGAGVTRLALNQPGNKFEGFGIQLGRSVHEALITGNTIRYFTKMGIETFSLDYSKSVRSRNIKITNNRVSYGAAAGIVNNSNAESILIDANLVEHIDAFWQYANTGFGMQLLLGSDFQVTNNIIRHSGRQAINLQPSCQLEVLGGYNNDYVFDCSTVVANNVLDHPCQGTLSANTGLTSGSFPFGQARYDDTNQVPFTFGITPFVLTGGAYYQSGSPPSIPANPDLASNLSWIDNEVSNDFACQASSLVGTGETRYNNSIYPLFIKLPESLTALVSTTDGTLVNSATDNSVAAYNTDGTVHEAPCTISDTGSIQCPTSGSTLDLAANSTLGGSIALKEASGNGTETFTLKVPDFDDTDPQNIVGGLTADRTCLIEDDGTPLDSCVTINSTTAFSECYTMFVPVPHAPSVAPNYAGSTSLGILDTYDVQSIWRAPQAVTITEMWCQTDKGEISMDLQIDSGTLANVAGVDLNCDSTGVADNSSLNGSMSAGNTLDIAISSVAIVQADRSDTPERLTVCFEYNYVGQ
jgi:hypothetical protein